MAEKISLQAGQRYLLDKDQVTVHLLSGKVDIFAYLGDNKRQIYLDSRNQGGCFFYLGNNDYRLRLMLLARENMELELVQLRDFTNEEALPADMLDGMISWLQSLWQLYWVRSELVTFLKLTDKAGLGQAEPAAISPRDAENTPFSENFFTNPWHVSWVQEFARHGKLNLATWCKASDYKKMNTQEAVQFFSAQQYTIASLLDMHIHNLDLSFDLRANKREKKTARLLESATSLLLGKVDREHADAQVESDIEGTGRLVLAALDYLKMDPVDLKLPQDVQNWVHGDEYLKLLLKKANILYRRVLLEPGWHRRDNGTLIFALDGEQVLALPVSDHSYNVRWADGRLAPLTDELAARISSIDAWLLYAGLPKRPLAVRDIFKFAYQHSWKSDWYTLFLVSFVAGLIPLLTPIITDKLFSDIIPVYDYQGVTTITQVMVVSAFTIAMLNFVRGVAVQRISTGAAGVSLDAALWGRLLSLPAGFFKQYSAGDLNQRFMSVDIFKSLLNDQMVSTIFNCIFSLWSLALMFYYSSSLTFASIAMWAVYLLLSWLIFYRRPMYQKELMKNNNADSSLTVQLFAGLSKFRCRGTEEQAFYLWSRTFSKKWQSNVDIRRLSDFSSVLNSVLSIIMMMVLYYYVMELAKKTETMVSVNDFLAFWSAYSGFNAAVLVMVPMAAQLIGMGAISDNVKPILEAVPEDVGDKLDAGHLTGEIELQDITFGYTEDKDILKNINLYIRAGESVAIVGPSGCGKSTLLRLLLGFEKPRKGMVLYDHKNLEDLSSESVRRQLGVVLQDGKLLPGNILQNIIGTQNLTLEDAWAAAKKAGLDKDISEMPMQMDTVISEDAGNISGGQKQRILLARSLAGTPSIMVLDEATSALDNKTQAIVAHSLDEMSCTRIVVAHRLSTIRNANHIIVLDKGSVVEEGTFDELMQRDGIFAQLAKRQIA